VLTAALLGAAAVGVLALTSDAEDDIAVAWRPTVETVTPPSSSDVVANPTIATSAVRPPSTAATVGATSGAVAPAPEPPMATSGWARRPLGADDAVGSLEDIATVVVGDGAVLLSAGTDGDRPLVLYSEDGQAWRPLTRRGLEAGGGARAVGADADRVVIVGRDANGPAAWQLRGGGAWVPVPVEGVDAGRIVLGSVAVRGDRTVVTGFDSEGSGFWTAEDDGDLQRRPVAAIEAAVRGETIVRDVVAVEDGFVAVGRADGSPMRWHSLDGDRWQAVPLADPDGGGTPVALSGDGLVVGGYDAIGGLWWAGGAGASRRRMPAPTDHPQTVDAVVVSGRTVVAIGRDGNEQACWTGAASETEEHPDRCSGSAALPAGALLRGLASWEGVVLGVGVDHQSHPGIWALAIEAPP